jgi:hypothetical protein
MSYNVENLRFKKLVLDSFNRQTQTSLTVENTTFLPQAPLGVEVARFVVVTKNANDELRLLVQLQPFSYFSDVSRFVMKLLPNYSAGSGNDEIWVANVVLSSSDYREFQKYLASREFTSKTSSPPFVVTQAGGRLRTQSGLAIKQQRF